MSLSLHQAATPAHFIDDLLQDTVLFVMDVHHNKTLKRDAAFYRRGCTRVESLKARLEQLNVSDEFAGHVLHAQCFLMDETVLSTAPQAENHIWLTAPMQARYLGTIHAGTGIPGRLSQLLHQPAPDLRLLIMYQRIFAMGLGRHSPEFEQQRRQLMASLDALVPVAETPLSAPLLVEHRPGSREGLLRSPVFRTAFLAVVTAALWYTLSHSLSSFLGDAFSG